MINIAEVLPLQKNNNYLGPATLISHEDDNGTVKVAWCENGFERTCAARIAISRTSPLQCGEEVLLTFQSESACYITGLFTNPNIPKKLVAKDVYATLAKNSDSSLDESLKVYTSKNELLFSYNSKTKTTRINVTKGDLEFVTEDGDIQFKSANKISLNGQLLEMNSTKFKLCSSYASFIINRMESTSNTLIENAKNVYRNVKELSQLRTGRMRTLIDKTYHFKANKAFVKTEEDYKVKAEKIHLG